MPSPHHAGVAPESRAVDGRPEQNVTSEAVHREEAQAQSVVLHLGREFVDEYDAIAASLIEAYPRNGCYCWPGVDDFPLVDGIPWPVPGFSEQCAYKWGPEWAKLIVRLAGMDSVRGVLAALLRRDGIAHEVASLLIENLCDYELHTGDCPEMAKDVINAACVAGPSVRPPYSLLPTLQRIRDADLRTSAARPLKLALFGEIDSYVPRLGEMSYDWVSNLILVLDTCPDTDQELVRRMLQRLPQILVTLGSNFSHGELRKVMGEIRLFFHHTEVPHDQKQQLAGAVATSFSKAARQPELANRHQWREFAHVTCLSFPYLSSDDQKGSLGEVLPSFAAGDDLLLVAHMANSISARQTRTAVQTGLYPKLLAAAEHGSALELLTEAIRIRPEKNANLLPEILKAYGHLFPGNVEDIDTAALLTFQIDPDGHAIEPGSRVEHDQTAQGVNETPICYPPPLAARRTVLQAAWKQAFSKQRVDAIWTTLGGERGVAALTRAHAGTSVHPSDWPHLHQALVAARASFPQIPVFFP
ncbi:hypothetical protein [Caenimonas sp. SL110]|uniref:hypothetical protein n=1 Tax=Caenimonas sp. SL110 TaxID=1450524 RepID=UPI00128DA123|nr:hypothetical protein [Caenimonas sp. SL110]